MAEESDGIQEALEGTLRVGLTAAARIGEQVARQREAAARQAQAEGESAAAQLAGRLNAEREAARASYAPLQRPDWWDAAQPEDIARAYQTAKAWGDVDPEAGRAEQRIVEELRSRYGVDLAAQATDPSAVRAALDQAEQARAEAGRQAGASHDDTLEGAQLLAEADAADRLARAQQATREGGQLAESEGLDGANAEVAPPVPSAQEPHPAVFRAGDSDLPILVTGAAEVGTDGRKYIPTAGGGHVPANQVVGADKDSLGYTAAWTRDDGGIDREIFETLARGVRSPDRHVDATSEEATSLQENARTAYDSADRRAEMADRMDGVADQATVEARVLADTSQARPATDATKTDTGRSPRARKSRKAPAKQVQRSGPTR